MRLQPHSIPRASRVQEVNPVNPLLPSPLQLLQVRVPLKPDVAGIDVEGWRMLGVVLLVPTEVPVTTLMETSIVVVPIGKLQCPGSISGVFEDEVNPHVCSELPYHLLICFGTYARYS